MSETTPSYETQELVPIEQLRALQSAKDRAAEKIRKRAYSAGFYEGYSQAVEDVETLLDKGRGLDKTLELLAEHCAKLQDWSLQIASKEVQDDDQPVDPDTAETDGTDNGGETAEDGS